jgi:hypothetical protein
VCKENLKIDDFMRNPVLKENGKDLRRTGGDGKIDVSTFK